MSDHRAFAGLVDLAAPAFGGRVRFASDEFFASAENLIRPEAARFDRERFTERGKWMDGWESRRRRGPGHDVCVLELGVPGHVQGFDIDTTHFDGNQPAFAGVDGLRAPPAASLDVLAAAAFRPLLPQVPLGPNCHNYFAAESRESVNYLRLSIFPDGGVARLRVFGTVEPQFGAPELDDDARREVPAGLVDLVAARNGGRALACSDAHFGAMNQLIMPGRATHMGAGWETRRARQPEHTRDFMLIKLAIPGRARVVELDTQHFFGNFPELACVEGLERPDASVSELVAATDWEPVLAQSKLTASTRHFLPAGAAAPARMSHVKLSIFPDGGVSRFRLWGEPHA
jgi:allantoicase